MNKGGERRLEHQGSSASLINEGVARLESGYASKRPVESMQAVWGRGGF